MRVLLFAFLLSLAACAANPEPVKQAAVEQPNCATEEVVKTKFAERLEYVGKLEGEKAKHFVEMVNNSSSMKVAKADFILIFRAKTAFVGIYFKESCAFAHVVGPVDALKVFFGTPV